MKKISFLLLLLTLLPLEAKALNTYDNGQILSYVAMPLAVSAVCDVRGVQTDRVGELVTYMNRANVEPTDFIDVFRYVPVALVLRTDNRPDFVGWVHGEVDRGLVGTALVTSMESRLRTYDDYVPVSNYQTRHRHYSRESYAYAYEPDYVPVTIRRHCDRLILDPLALVEMPVAVTNVYDLGVPYDRVSGLVVELNLGGVAPVQFVEVMRYAPVALVASNDYYGQPDFVQFVRTRRLGGISGYPLVQAVDQQLRYYDVSPQIDYVPPVYASQTYYVPQVAQNFVEPVSPAFFPATVQTRVVPTFAAGRTAVNQPAPAIAAAPQVQRLLQSPTSGAVVANPAQMRRELARANRAQREAPIAAAPTPFAQGNIENRGHGHGRVAAPVLMPMISSAPPAIEHGRGHGKGHAASAPSFVPTPAVTRQEHGRGHAAPAFVPPPAATPAPPREHGHGRGHEAPAFVQTPAPAQAAPQEHGHGRGHGAPAPVAAAPAPTFVPAPAPQPAVTEQHGHGHGQPANAGPPAGPPGQEKKKGKGKD
jgi:hypothetical protein